MSTPRDRCDIQQLHPGSGRGPKPQQSQGKVGSDAVLASIVDVTEVAPVVALLLLKVVFEKEEWSLSEVETIGVHVLDRILRRSGSSPTRDVGEILDGLIALECFPDTHSIRRWIDHLPTGRRCFIYNTPSITLITSTEVWMRGPSHQNQNQEASDDGCTIFVPYAGDEAQFATETVTTPKPLESRLSHTSIHARAIHTQEEIEEPASYRVRLHESSPHVDMGAFIVDKLKADPVLLNRFLQVRQIYIAKQVRPIRYETTYRQHVCITLLNLQAIELQDKVYIRAVKGAAVVHGKLTAERHRDKEPAVYVTSQIRYEAVLCKPLPGMLTRSFDWGFGVEGSRLHISNSWIEGNKCNG
ncbi:Hypothetical protein PHPALM_36997 [Phytophthora palmivora]|uniref:Uncharacterized protein n=1 Tax=Phytophthora palmivora TaxID=4796 RepID=A0A2P4WYI6_9STRA|nr:Hypothetical protein PHPALM_36997 [Phytophthora palmivora]